MRKIGINIGLKRDLDLDAAIRKIKELGFDCVFTGVPAIKQGMMAQSRLRILMADRSKIGEWRAFRIGMIKDFHILVCDADPGPTLTALCREHGVRLIYRGC